MRISVIIPIKEEAENIDILAEELTSVLDNMNREWECIWVDDGSRDNSLSILERLCREDPKHRFISFSENAGQSAAFYAGFRAAAGDFIVTIDGDGQNDPSDIPLLMETLLSKDLDMVNGYRTQRRDTFIKKVSSYIANGFRNIFTGKTVRDVGCSIRVFRRECVENIPGFKGMHRFLPTLVAMDGFKMTEVPVNHRPRLHGVSKYSINNRLWVGLLDVLGVLWLKKRKFYYSIRRKSRSRIQ